MKRVRKGLARSWRRISGIGEAELVPQARLSGPMPWVIAIMGRDDRDRGGCGPRPA